MNTSIYTGELSLEDRRLFWNGYDKLAALFGGEALDREILKLRPSQIVDVYNAPLEGPNLPGRRYTGDCFRKPQRDLGLGAAYVTFHNGDWEQHKNVRCHKYLVPAQYQGLQHGAVIEAMLLEKYPGLARYKLAIYEMRFNDRDEFYVATSKAHGGHKSLYVPYSAFLARDIETVIERNRSYLKDYTKSEAVWESMKDDPVVIDFFKEMSNELET